MQTTVGKNPTGKLYFLLLAGLIPILLFIAFMLFAFTRQQEKTIDMQLNDTSLHAAHQVERLIVEQLGLLNGLGASRALDEGDLESFREDAARLWKMHPEWRTVILTDRDSQVLNLRIDPGKPFPDIRDDQSLRMVWETREPFVGDYRRRYTALRAPVIREGVIKYTLVAPVDPNYFQKALDARQTALPHKTLIIGGDGKVISASPGLNLTPGEPPPKDIPLSGHSTSSRKLLLSRPVRITPSNWRLLVIASSTEVEEPFINRRIAVYLGGFAAVGLTALLLIILASARASALEAAHVRRTFEQHQDMAKNLEINEQRLRLAQEAAWAGTWEWNLNTNEHVWSDLLYRLYRLDPDKTAPSYSAWIASIHPEDADGVENAFKEALTDNKPISVEWRIQPGNGPERWLMSRGRPIKDSQGRIDRYLGIVIDITDRKAMEDALRESEEMYRTTLNSIGDAVIAAGPTGHVEHINPVASALTGWSEEESIGKPLKQVFRIVSEKNNRELENPAEKIVREGQAAGLANHTLLVSRDGRKTPIADSGAPIISPNGEIVGVVLVFRDQTEERKVQKRIRESEERYRSLFNSIRDAIVITDNNRSIIDCNPAFFELFGYSADEILGQNTMAVYADEKDYRRQGEALENRVHESPYLTMVDYRKKSGIIFPGETNIYPLKDDQGDYKGFIGLIRDVTEKKLAEVQLERLAQQRQLALNAARLGWWHYSPMSRIASYDERYREIFGIEGFEKPNDEILNNILHPEDLPTVWAAVEAALDPIDPKPYSPVFRIIRPDGELRWIQAHGIAVFEGQGRARRAAGFVGTVADITERKKVENALTQSEEELRKAQRFAHVGSWRWDIEAGLVSWSDEMYRLFGLEKSGAHVNLVEVIDKAIHPEDRKKVEAANRRLIEERINLPMEYRVIWPDGKIHVLWAEAGEIETNDKNKPVFVRGYAQDITKRKMAENALRESERMIRTMAVNIPGMLYSSRHEDQSFRFISKSKEISGYPAERFLYGKMKWTDVVHEQDLDEVFEHRARLWKERRAVTKEYRIISQNGEVRWVEDHASPRFSSVGELEGIDGVIFDVTGRRAMEESLLQLAAAIEQAAEVVLVTDKRGLIQYVNPAFEETSGYSKAEVMGKNPRLLKSGAHAKSFYQQMWEVISSGRVWQGRLINLRKDGTRYTEEATISPVRNAKGEIVNYVAVKRDITNELTIENQLRQAQKMEAVGRLAGGVAHDFNNMLSVILGHMELLLSGVDKSDIHYEELKNVQEAAQRSSELTKQLLAFARRQHASPVILDLNSPIENMLKMLRRLIGESIELDWQPDKNPCPVRIDPAQIDQILANLCINARDAMEGVGRVIIKTANVLLDETFCQDRIGCRPGEYILLSVTDNGKGMESDTVEHIFEPFFTTKDISRGSGLGLATVYGIVSQNNGMINVISSPGKGTTFEIHLPRHHKPIERALEKPTEQPHRGSGETILLVEDSPPLLQLGKKMLIRLGYNVLTAETPGEALNLVQGPEGKDLDLLITDVVMPEMNGRELALRIEKMNPDLKCLYVSGYTADIVASQGVLIKGVHFLQKPFDMDTLSRKVREALAPARDIS